MRATFGEHGRDPHQRSLKGALGQDVGYRADIDGLRGLAVLAVVGYHAFPYWFRGGFIGVDVFFVISGFLISSIIISGLEHHRFSLAAFYGRRIRRIFPALLIVLASCCVGGWFLLFADEYKQLGKHIAAGAGFVANLTLWREGGYFDHAAETKALLHLWSLGIEEQFYIAWPVLLCFLIRHFHHALATTLALAAASFALSLHVLSSDEIASFYSPQTRFWELLIGAALAQVSRRRATVLFGGGARAANAQSVTGLALIGIGLVTISQEHPFPGWRALLPTVGAALIIAAGSSAWLNRKVLAGRLLVGFGLISFPLYLWHWPLLTFARIVESEMPSRTTRVALVFVAVALSWLTYRLVERPIRQDGRGATKVIMLVGLTAVVGAAGVECYRRDGFDGYGPRSAGTREFANHFENSLPDWQYYERTQAFKTSRVECNFYDVAKFRVGQATRVPLEWIHSSCYERDRAHDRAVLIWGDSHAQQLYFGLSRTLPQNWQILQVASSDCAPDASVLADSATNHCTRSNWFAMKTIREARPDVVLVAQKLGHNKADMDRTVASLKAMGVRSIIFVGPTPQWTSHLPNLILRRLWPDTPERTRVGVDTPVMAANTQLRQTFTPQDGVYLVDLIGFFCNQAGCLTRIGPDRMTGITSADYGHLTPVASEHLARQLLADVVLNGASRPR
jgi:peptidoglycan/LPS O-acetylase OafA/YrhL